MPNPEELLARIDDLLAGTDVDDHPGADATPGLPRVAVARSSGGAAADDERQQIGRQE